MAEPGVREGAGPLAVTWWGHATTTVELGPARVLTDPVLTRALLHLRRTGPLPGPDARRCDLVLLSHLHHDHLHLRSLRRVDPAAPLVAPRGVLDAVGARTRRLLRRREVHEVAPGEEVDVAGVRVEVLAADHPGTRDPVRAWRTRHRGAPPALAFRVRAGGRCLLYAGDTGRGLDLGPAPADGAGTDLALVPIGGWGPTLGPAHLGPAAAAEVVAGLGPGAVLGVHHGTFWPVGLRALMPGRHRRLFVAPGPVFAAAVRDAAPGVRVLSPAFGERVPLRPGERA